jgi:DNA-directed RNA polymerase specialized sigma24 family protein
MTRDDTSSTQWFLIDDAQDARSAIRRPAVEELIRHYLPALRSHLIFRMRLDEAAADDVVQGFLVDRVLNGRLLAAADPGKGRFRSLLVRSLENYALDTLRRDRKLASRVPLSLDEQGSGSFDSAASSSSETSFSVGWARELLLRTLREMRDECRQQGCEARWSLFERRVLRPIFEDVAPPSYENLLDEFRFASPQQAANALVSAKRHFERVLGRVIAEYTDSEEELRAELADLQSVVAAAGPLGLRLELLDAPGSSVLWPSASTDIAHQSTAGLFSLNAVADSIWSGQDLSGLWRHLLSQRLDSVIQNAGQPAHTRLAPPYGATTIAEYLRSASPELEVLQALKDVAKTFCHSDKSDLPGDIATAFYLMCIATAITKHGRRITSSADSVLIYGITLILTRTWLDAETRQLLEAVVGQLRDSNQTPARSGL